MTRINIMDLPKKYQDQAEKKMQLKISQNKYRNTKVEINGIKFDSIKEGERYHELYLLQKAGEISDLRLQEEFVLQNAYRSPENGEKKRAIKYLADFTYEVNGERIIEDAKGVKTPVYQIKKKMMESAGNTIREV